VGEFLYFRLAPNEFQVYQYFSTVLYIFKNLNKGACVLPLKLILSFEQMTNDIFMCIHLFCISISSSQTLRRQFRMSKDIFWPFVLAMFRRIFDRFRNKVE